MTIKKSLMLGISIFTASTFITQYAEASTAFSGTGEVSITITSITNLSNPGTGYGNDIYYSGLTEFDPLNGPYKSGNGSFNPTPTGDLLPTNPTLVTESFSFQQGLQINGTIINGEMSPYFVGWSEILLDNFSADDYQINYTVNYNLSVLTNEEFSESTFWLTGDGLGLNGDYVDVYSNSQISSSASANDSSALSLVVFGNDSASFYAELGFEGNAIASPVPVPAAIWFMLSGLLALPRFKIKHK